MEVVLFVNIKLLTSVDYFGPKTPVPLNLMESSDHVKKSIYYVSGRKFGYHATIVATISAGVVNDFAIIELLTNY
jgi:hypothetical protein